MGDNSTLVIVESDRIDVYRRRGPEFVSHELISGPHYTESLIRSHRQGYQYLRHLSDKDERKQKFKEAFKGYWFWNNCSTLLLDIPNQTLLFSEPGELNTQLPIRRLYLKTLAKIWPNWSIRWAYEGIVDVAEYLGVSRREFIPESETNFVGYFYLKHKPSLIPSGKKCPVLCIGSFHIKNTIKLFPLWGRHLYFLSAGPDLLEDCDRYPSHTELDYSDWSAIHPSYPRLGNYFPEGGFQINPAAKTVDFWMSEEEPAPRDKVKSRWPGWKVNWHKDDYQSQIALTKGAVKFREPSEQALAEVLADRLLSVEAEQAKAEARSRAVAFPGVPVRQTPEQLVNERKAILEKAFLELEIIT